MAMRETVGSLQAYFIVVALLTGVRSMPPLLNEPLGPGTIFLMLGIVFAMAYLYAGIRLKALLARAPRQVLGIILAAGALVGVSLIASLVDGSALGVGFTVVELLVVWYLYANVRRLAAEAHAAPLPPRGSGAAR